MTDEYTPTDADRLDYLTFCVYCGGNDETPPDHCQDCTRPDREPSDQEGLK